MSCLERLNSTDTQDRASEKPASDEARLLPISAESDAALAQRANELAEFLESAPESELADVEHTLQREPVQPFREAVICHNRDIAISALRGFEPRRAFRGSAQDRGPVFLFPGQAGMYPGMGAALYAKEPAFRAAFDECRDAIGDQFPLGDILLAHGPDSLALSPASDWHAEPAVFSVSYALARMWMAFGVQPAACAGYGVGEFVAAALAGVLPLSDALTFISARARVAHALPPGAILSARLSETEAQQFLNERIRLAAVDGPRLVLFTGANPDIDLLEAELAKRAIPTKRPATALAFHSPKLAAMAAPLEQLLASTTLKVPSIPLFSTVRANWLSETAAVSRAYWATHAVSPARFAPSLEKLIADGHRTFLECGPGDTLSALFRPHAPIGETPLLAIPSMVAAENELESALCAMGQLWVRGQNIQWETARHDSSGKIIDLSIPAPPPEPPIPASAPGAELKKTFPEEYAQFIATSTQHAAESATFLASTAARDSMDSLMHPIICERAEDALLWDLEGHEFIDITLGEGALIFGHRSPLVHGAIEAHWEMGVPLLANSPAAGNLARQLTEFLQVERVAFCEDGKRARETALELARAATGRKAIAVLLNKDAPGVDPNLEKLVCGSPESLVWLEAHADDLAAIVVDPLQAEGVAADYFSEVQKRARSGGAAIIVDETFTGFRAAPRGAQEKLGVEADLACFGNLLAGGLPFGFVAGRGRFMSGNVCNTHAHPLALAVAEVMLRHLDDAGQRLQAELSRKTEELVTAMNEHLAERQVPARWHSFASAFQLSGEIENPALLFAHARKRGVHAWHDRPCFLSTAHTDAQIERIAAVFAEAIAAISEQTAPGPSIADVLTPPVAVVPQPTPEPEVEIEARVPEQVILTPTVVPLTPDKPIADAKPPESPAPAVEIPEPAPNELSPPPVTIAGPERDPNATARPFPANAGVDTLFERVAAANESAVAIVEGSRRISYGTLNTHANMLARQVGAVAKKRSSQRIGVCLDRGADFVTACLAIVKSGCAYVPIDPAWPAERALRIAELAGVATVVTDLEHARHFPGRALLIDGPKPAVAPSSEDPAVRTDGGTIACILFTSGAIGAPLGISVPHRAIAGLVLNNDAIPLSARDVIGNAASAASDAATLEMWGPLLNGGSIAVLSKEAITSPAQLTRELREKAVTVLHLSGHHFQQVTKAAPEAFQTLKQLLIGGTASTHGINSARNAAPTTRLTLVHGPAELLGFSCYLDVSAAISDGATISAGRPMSNVTAEVLDANRQACAVGVAGELFYGGARVPAGYYQQGGLSAERFGSDPHNAGSTLFRSGDGAMRQADGSLEFLGRNDRQVTIRGMRVEPAEVEAELSRHPKIHTLTIKPLSTASDKQGLAAYFLPRNGETLSAAELCAFARRRLPESMVPSAWVRISEFPLLPDGSINVDELPSPSTSQFLDLIPARSEIEARVVTLMASALGIPSIGRTDEFFQLGGDALKTMDFLARVHAELGVALTESDLREHATVAALSEHIASLQPKRAAEGPFHFLAPIQRGDARKRPIFFVPGGTGGDADLQLFSQVGRLLDPTQPVWGLRSGGRPTGHTSTHNMAADYLREIRAIQPHGPYYLFGDSVGGICAHEIACQLREDGGRVSRLILLDTTAPGPDELAEFLARQNAPESGPAGGKDKASVQSLTDRMRFLFSKGAPAPAVKATAPPKITAQSPTDNAGYVVTLMRHRLRPFAGKVCLIVNSESLQLHGQLGWETAPIGELDLQVIAGTRGYLLRDHAPLVALKLKEILAE